MNLKTFAYATVVYKNVYKNASMLFWAQPKAQAGLKGAETLKASAVDCPVIKYTRSQHFQKV